MYVRTVCRCSYQCVSQLENVWCNTWKTRTRLHIYVGIAAHIALLIRTTQPWIIDEIIYKDWPLQQRLYKHTDHCHLVHCLGWRGKVLQSQQKVAVEQSIYSQAYYGGVSPWEGPLPKEDIGEQLDCLPELALVELEMEGGWALQLSVGKKEHTTKQKYMVDLQNTAWSICSSFVD